MKPLTLTLTLVLAALAFVLIAQNQSTFAADDTKKEDSKKDDAEKDAEVETPADRVVVMYFHRTKRCPTCKKIGGYVDDAVNEKYPDELKAKTVELYFVDFQKTENADLTNAYSITGPTLVMAKITGDKVEVWKTMPEVWKLVGDKDKFFTYVQDGVEEYRTTEEEGK